MCAIHIARMLADVIALEASESNAAIGRSKAHPLGHF
jgi:hypothetical protein